MNGSIRRATTFAIVALLLYAVAIPAHATTITVTNTNDSGPGSLCQALADANDHDTVDFDPSLNGQFITATSSEFVIDKNITISGPGPDFLSVGSKLRGFTATTLQRAGLLSQPTLRNADRRAADRGTVPLSSA